MLPCGLNVCWPTNLRIMSFVVILLFNFCLLLNYDLRRCSCLWDCLSSTDLILWGSNFLPRAILPQSNGAKGLMRCSVSLPARGLNSPASKSFQWSPFPISPPAKREKPELLQISHDSRPKHHFQASVTQQSDQESGGGMLMGLQLTVLLCSWVGWWGALLVFWPTSGHQIESCQGHR